MQSQFRVGEKKQEWGKENNTLFFRHGRGGFSIQISGFRNRVLPNFFFIDWLIGQFLRIENMVPPKPHEN